VSRDGAWYVLAHCHTAGGERLFRLDRIRSAELTDDAFEPVPVEQVAGWDLSATPRTVEIVAGADAGWVATTYPCDEAENLPDGRVRLVLPVTATPWLERLLLRLGPGTEVRDASTGEDLARVGTGAAERILGRYRATAPRGDR
jgi:proteasome accessory factor C